MTNIKVEAFSIYGVGQTEAVQDALLAGAWAEIPLFANPSIVYQLPWDTTDTSWWLSGNTDGTGANTTLLRGVLPSAASELVFSFHCAVAELPPENSRIGPIEFRNGANAVIATLYIQSTGAIAFNYGAGVAVTGGPVMVAEREHHFEARIKTSATTAFELYIDGTRVINATAWAPTNAGPMEQFSLVKEFTTGIGDHFPAVYVSHFIIRTLAGTYNNSFPMGDRRVATLLVDSDDLAHQGWTPQPLQRFGAGILQTAAFTAASVPETDLGNDDFTLEGQFRFDTLPAGTDVAVLVAKWRTDNNTRSYRLYKGGPSANNGHLVFQTSTDGTSGTTAIKFEWPWQPDVGVWYHVAMCRDAGNLKLFIDGIEQGLPIADSNTYFAGSERTVLGAQQSSIGGAESQFDGWIDELRITVGLSRYSANFAPPTTLFPRGGGDDPDWAFVALLTGFDTGTIADDGPNALTMSAVGGGAALTPGDGDDAYETLNKHTPSDITFIEAALLPATGTFTLTVNAGNNETVTLGTTDGATPAVYRFRTVLATAFDVLIGINIAATVTNLVAAINGEAGEGTLYGTGTTVNHDASGELMPSNQMLATATVAGAAGNSIVSTETCANGSWSDTTLDGGADIPGYSNFGLEPLPRNATVVDSVTLVTRQWKTDAGATTTQTSLVGPDGASDNGADRAVSSTPTFYFDTFEEDPDTSAALTPATVNNGKARINRTT